MAAICIAVPALERFRRIIFQRHKKFTSDEIEQNERKNRTSRERRLHANAVNTSIIDSSVCIRMCIYYLLKKRRINDAIKQMEVPNALNLK